jgi:phosphatidylglycerol lysyltransferase
MSLLAAGVVASLTKGIAVEEALILALIAVLLFALRSAFYRSSDLTELRPSPRWLATVLAGVVAAICSASSAIGTSTTPTNSGGSSRSTAMPALPARQRRRRRDPDLGRDRGAHPPAPGTVRTGSIDDDVRRLVASSPRSQANVAFLGDKKFVFAADRRACLMYGRFGRSWISMGDPIGDPSAAPDLIWRLRELADQAGGRAVYYAVGPTNLPTYLDMGFSVLKIAEVARVDLSEFSLIGKKAHDFRYADRRSQKEGISFEIIPKCEVPRYFDQLKAVSDAWLAHKSGSEKGFSLGAFSPAYLKEFDCAVMRNADGIQAFANIWRGAGDEEMSIDMMRYRPQGRAS